MQQKVFNYFIFRR